MKEKILKILDTERRLREDKAFAKKCAIPENCYVLGDGEVLCYPRTTGDSRYPYSSDGLTLWAYSSGEMSLNESAFYCILPSDEGKEPYTAFFGGIESPDGGYTPLSITGVARQGRERNVSRFTYYTPHAVYYITQTPQAVYAVRAFVSQDKKAVFSVCAINKTDKPVKTYLSSFFNCLFMHQAGESVETKWFKQCKTTDHGFMFESVEDLDRTTHLKNYGVINRAVDIRDLDYAEHTTSRSDYAGGKTNSLGFATPLFDGHFRSQKRICKFSDTAAAGDIYCFTLGGNDHARIDYVMQAIFDEKEANAEVKSISVRDADRAEIAVANAKTRPELTMRFGKFDGVDINNDAFTEFVSNVERQVQFAALAKNSGVSMLGVRDVAQQLEAALMWTPLECRKKFIELFDYLDPSGRPLRQYSVPKNGASPQVDTREHVDQGNWIISAIHTYLSFTDDYSLLDEQCGYYKIIGRNCVEKTSERNTLAEHLSRIADFLISNTDEKTGCLHALYGDWNDALDGLGVSNDPNKEYGTGVSVMASLHLYKNLDEMLGIIDKFGDKFGKREKYLAVKQKLESGLKKYAIVKNNGERKILHGWGDELSYTVGSYADVDGKSRDGLTANAFWVVSGAYLWDKSIKRDILRAYGNLDSKYGFKTFEPYFAPDAKGVGRIVNLPKGTAENGATYVHATMFGIWSLFGMGEGKLGWKQLEKVLPLTHDIITTTPFIMSNSYSYNEELGLDGESMNDWFTGSANALVKALVWYVFGIRPDLNGLHISPAEYMPFDSANISLTVKGKKITLDYKKVGGSRKITFNGKQLKISPDPSSDAPSVYILTSELKDNNEISVTD